MSRVSESKACSMLRLIQTITDVAAGTPVTDNAAIEMTSVIETKFKSIPTLQADEAEPETALSSSAAKEQPVAQGPELASASASIEAEGLEKANARLHNEQEAEPGSQGDQHL